MSRWFGRGRKGDVEPDTDVTDADVVGDDATGGDGTDGTSTSLRGPYDSDEDYPPGHRIDLGALRIPTVQGTSCQVEVDKASGVARSASVITGPSRVTLDVLAAPRTAGIWDEVRAEIVADVRKVGGTAVESDGAFGTEVISAVPTKLPDGRQAMRVRRHVGIDGPRWFLRAVFTGPEVVSAAGIPTAAGSVEHERTTALEEVVRGCVVVRGPQARPPRERLSLTLPVRRAAGDPAATSQSTDAGADDALPA